MIVLPQICHCPICGNGVEVANMIGVCAFCSLHCQWKAEGQEERYEA